MVSAQSKQVPSLSSGHLDVSRVVQTGFVRVTGISVIVAGAVGALHDINSITGAASSNKIYEVAATKGFYPVNLIFATGLTYVPGAAQEIAIMYTRI